IRILSSYVLGLVVLAFMMVLLVLGTWYQAEHGLFRAQKMFYDSYIVLYPLGTSGLALPLPGTRLLVAILIVNLSLATIFRIRYRVQVLGVYVVHIGILILLIGGFITAYGSYEGYMTIDEGKAANFSERFYEDEIAIVEK